MKVYSYVMTIVKNAASAEEITQQTFFNALKSKDKFRSGASEFTWLCSIAKNLCTDEFRKESKQTECNENELTADGSVGDTLEDRDISLQIHIVLHSLEEPYKEVFQLRVFGELSFKDIGVVFGKTENWARVTYHRARLKIQEKMGDLNG